MVRPILKRRLSGSPISYYFKPQGIPLRLLEEIIMEADEFEAIRLYDYCGLSQNEAAAKMNISQPTFARILDKAYKKIAKALIEGKAIKILDNF